MPGEGASTVLATCVNTLCVDVQGVSTGTDIAVAIRQVSSLTARTTVSVVSTPVCLTKISVVAYTGASWLSPPASISPIGLITAQLLPLQVTANLWPNLIDLSAT